MDVDRRRNHRAPAVRQPGRLFPGHARRGEARPHVSERRSRDGLHDEQSARHPFGGADRARRGRRHRRGQSLAALRLEDDFARRQRADAPARRRCGRRRDRDVSRRASHRSVGVERPRGEGRHDRRAAERRADPARHHLRRRVGFRARSGDPVRNAPGDARPRRSPPTRCGSRRRRRKCSRSPRSTASRSPAGSRGRSSGRCTRSSRRTSRGRAPLHSRRDAWSRTGRDGTRGPRPFSGRRSSLRR